MLCPSRNTGRPGAGRRRAAGTRRGRRASRRSCSRCARRPPERPWPAQVEPVHRPAVGHSGVDDRAVAPGVLAEPVADQQHPGRRRRGQPALPEQLDATRAGQPTLHVLRRRHQPCLGSDPSTGRRPIMIAPPPDSCTSDLAGTTRGPLQLDVPLQLRLRRRCRARNATGMHPAASRTARRRPRPDPEVGNRHRSRCARRRRSRRRPPGSAGHGHDRTDGPRTEPRASTPIGSAATRPRQVRPQWKP